MRWSALAVLFAFAGEAHAFELSRTRGGTPLRFPEATFEYDVVFAPATEDGERFSAAVRRAFDTWGSASRGVLTPIYRGPGALAAADGRWTVAEVPVWNPIDGETDRTIASTHVQYDTITGVIMEADIRLNTERFRFAEGDRGAFDPQSVVLHEIGHGLGFAHSCGDPGTTYPSCFDIDDDPPGTRARILDAVMAPTLAAGNVGRVLAADDLAALDAHYARSATIAEPHPSALSADCALGAHVLTCERFPPGARVVARTSTGGARPLEVRLEGPLPIIEDLEPGRLDVLVTDPATRAYGALVDVAAAEPCAPPPPDAGPPPEDAGTPPEPEESGCGCTAGSRQGGAASAMLVLVLALALLRRAAMVIPVLLLAVAPADAFAFKCSRVGADFGPSLVWTVRSVPWYAGAGGSDDLGPEVTLEQLRLSYQAWSEVSCSDLDLPFMGAEPGLAAGFDERGPNKNVVVFIESGWKYDPTVIAVTTNAFDTTTGMIVDSDIEVNGEHFRFVVADDTCDPTSGKMDLRNAITHEVGHVIGLDHPPNTARYAPSTMFASAPSCETKKRSLEQDDIEGVCAIYPTGAETRQCFPPNGPSFALVESNDGFGGCRDVRGDTSLAGVFVAALLGIALRRRR